MSTAIIGATGFVGSSLLRQRDFEHHFHSRNIQELTRRSYDLIVCAGAPAQKWIANRDPTADRARLAPLMDALRSVECSRMVLISTVDVFSRAVGVDETSSPDVSDANAYGRNRLELEECVKTRFPDALIVRLPGLVGPGLRKNAIFDFQHMNNLDAVDSRARFQFYPVVQLWADIGTALLPPKQRASPRWRTKPSVSRSPMRSPQRRPSMTFAAGSLPYSVARGIINTTAASRCWQFAPITNPSLQSPRRLPDEIINFKPCLGTDP
jgi:hypothetical protein